MVPVFAATATVSEMCVLSMPVLLHTSNDTAQSRLSMCCICLRLLSPHKIGCHHCCWLPWTCQKEIRTNFLFCARLPARLAHKQTERTGGAAQPPTKTHLHCGKQPTQLMTPRKATPCQQSHSLTSQRPEPCQAPPQHLPLTLHFCQAMLMQPGVPRTLLKALMTSCSGCLRPSVKAAAACQQ